MSPPPSQYPFATLMLNGVQLVRCNIPVEESSKQTTSATASMELRQVLASGASLECVLLSPNVSAQPNIAWAGSLIVDDVYEVDIGSFTSKRQAARTTYDWLANPPHTLVLTIACQRIDPLLPVVNEAEQRLVNLVKTVLEDDEVNPRRGSLPSRLVGEKTEEADKELYDKVIGEAHPNWNSFITSHESVFNVFQYGEQEIVNRGMEGIGMIGELRMVLRQKERSRLSAEEQAIEEQLTAFLKNLLAEQDLTTDEILQKIATQDELIQYVSPAFSVLMRALNKHRDSFTWTTDPGKPTVISVIGPDAPSHPRLERPKNKRLTKEKKNEKIHHFDDTEVNCDVWAAKKFPVQPQYEKKVFAQKMPTKAIVSCVYDPPGDMPSLVSDSSLTHSFVQNDGSAWDSGRDHTLTDHMTYSGASYGPSNWSASPTETVPAAETPTTTVPTTEAVVTPTAAPTPTVQNWWESEVDPEEVTTPVQAPAAAPYVAQKGGKGGGSTNWRATSQSRGRGNGGRGNQSTGGQSRKGRGKGWATTVGDWDME